MTSERLFNSFIPQKNLCPQNKFLATPLPETRISPILFIFFHSPGVVRRSHAEALHVQLAATAAAAAEAAALLQQQP